MRAGVIPLGSFAHIGMNYGFYFLSEMNWLARLHFVRSNTLHRHDAAVHVGDDVAGAIAEHSDIADLTAGVGVERRVIEDDLAFFAGFQFGNALTIFYDSEHFAVGGRSLFVTLEVGLAEITIDRAG